MLYEKVFDVGCDIEDQDEALEFAECYCWSECETSEQHIAFANHIDTVNGVGVHYCYGADHYFFTDEEK